MKLTAALQAEIKSVYELCVNGVCDACHKLLDHIRYTRKDQPGEWCSRVCRDGVEAVERYKATRKQRATGRCWHCGLQLPNEVRAGSKYCDTTCERNARHAKAGSRASRMAA
jgi:hypothetical protein